MQFPVSAPRLRLLVLASALSLLVILFLRSALRWEPVAQVSVAQSHTTESKLIFDHTPLNNEGPNAVRDPGQPSTNQPFAFVADAPPNDPSPPPNVAPEAKPGPRNAIVTAIWDYSYASLALMLGYSLKKHNDLNALSADLILLTLEPDDEWLTGLTSWNKTILRNAGWQIKAEPRLEVFGVDMKAIQPHRRLNLNKIRIFGWEQYDRILFMDADTICKGSIAELFSLSREVEFAAGADAWPNMEIDAKFNSGVMLFRPSSSLYYDMLSKLADKKYHDPKEGDQQFLQNYWRSRDWKLPTRFNLNLVHYYYSNALWKRVWPDSRIVHFTERKPRELWNGGWCANKPKVHGRVGANECAQWEPLQWYKAEFEKMRKDLKLENQIGVLG